MTDTTPTDVTSSENSDVQSSNVSATKVCEAIEKQPDAWLQEDNQLIATHSVGDATAKEICRAFENQQFPDGTPLSNHEVFFGSQRVKDAFGDYLLNTDEWKVHATQNVDPWITIYSAYENSDKSIRKARQKAVDQLKDELHIESLEHADEIVWYNEEKGIYESDAERIVNERLEAKLRGHNTRSEARQISHKLDSQHSVKQDAFTPESKVCTTNGVLDVSDPLNPELDSHSPEYRFRERLPVEYDPDADCPRFKKFISERVPGRDIDKLQEFAGYTVFHPWSMRYQKALMIVGPTDTGKSTFLKVLTALLGEQNVSNLSLQQLADDHFALGQVRGTVANICNDLDADKVSNLARFKQLTAGDRLDADEKNEDYRTVHWTQKQIYAANQVPELEYADNAFYRRWLHIEFPEQIPENQRRGHFEDELKKELPGILNWALEGYARLMQNEGFTNELGLEQKRNLWKEYGNSIDRFVDNRAELVPNTILPKDKVHSAYTTFCAKIGRQAKPKNSFCGYITSEYNVERTRRTIHGERVRCLSGLQLPSADKDETQQQDSPDWPDELSASE